MCNNFSEVFKLAGTASAPTSTPTPRTHTMSQPRHLYHYTDAQSINKIASSGKLLASTGPGDAALGPGVYFTSTALEQLDAALEQL